MIQDRSNMVACAKVRSVFLVRRISCVLPDNNNNVLLAAVQVYSVPLSVIHTCVPPDDQLNKQSNMFLFSFS